MLDHVIGHFHSVLLLSFDIGDDCALGFSGDNVDIDGLFLTETPATAHGLIKLLV